MALIHPKTWDDGVMPLEEFPPQHLASIQAQVESEKPPTQWLRIEGIGQIESRAWYEWHWTRGMKLRRVGEPTRRRKLPTKLRARVIERDGFNCGICAMPVEPIDVHIDHIHPVSLGGTDEMNNLRVTHSLCNIRKGARVDVV